MARLAVLALVLSACGGGATVAASTPHRWVESSVLPLGTTMVRPTTTTRASRSRVTVTTRQMVTPQIGTALQVARASWYGEGTRTASGARFSPDELTFASRTLPFGQRVRFTYRGRAVTATCTDRGPTAATGRLFDLSRASFAALAPLSTGVIAVEWEVIQ